jgi:hypothetical protein
MKSYILCLVARGGEGFEMVKIMVINDDLAAEYLSAIKCRLRNVTLLRLKPCCC